jgi:hypothetical protein
MTNGPGGPATPEKCGEEFTRRTDADHDRLESQAARDQLVAPRRRD